MSIDFNLFSGKPKEENKEYLEKLGGIFHDYDIRGKYPEELNEQNFKLLSQSIIVFLKSMSTAFRVISDTASIAWASILTEPKQLKSLKSGDRNRL